MAHSLMIFYHMKKHRLSFAVSLIWLILFSCNGSGLLSKRTAHEDYEHSLRSAGLLESELGIKWRKAASAAIEKPIAATLPFREKNYHSAEKPWAVGYKFPVKRGMKIYITHRAEADSGVKVFLDV